ncbi:unnamed protein product [Lupinus luteus]|uniref:Uncharacterized protein n=1 Tax=Lupinus luteus TaxID=3873 RepID=A0AAV1WB57_LUPLU
MGGQEGPLGDSGSQQEMRRLLIWNTLTLGTGAWPKSRVAQSSIKEIPVMCPIHYDLRISPYRKARLTSLVEFRFRVDGSTSYNHEAEVIVLEGLLPRMKLDSGAEGSYASQMEEIESSLSLLSGVQVPNIAPVGIR